MIKIKSLVVCLGVLFTGSALAGPEFYIKGGVGITSVDADLNIDVASFGYDSISDSDTSLKLAGGMMFNRYVGIELAYNDYNEHSESYSIIVDPFFGDTLSGTADLSVSAASFSVIGAIPLGDKFSLYGKLGLARWDADFNDSFTLDIVGIGSFSDAISESETGSDIVYGLGARLKINDTLAFGLEYSRFSIDIEDIEDTGVDLDSDVDTFSFDLSICF